MTLDQVCALAIAHEITQFNPDEIHFTSQGLMDFVRQVEAEAYKKAAEACEDWKSQPAYDHDIHYNTGVSDCVESIRALIPAPAASSADDGVKCKTCRAQGKCERCHGLKKILDGESVSPCPDCTLNTREEKQAKCVCAVPNRPFICAQYNGIAGYCKTCTHDRACHKGDTGNE